MGELGIDFIGKQEEISVGHWYQSKRQKGAFVSIIKPSVIEESILTSHEKYVKPMESVEKNAASYMIAFDLSQYKLHFSLGTEHPRVGWSARVREADRDLSLVGPDGIDTIDPLTGTGLIPPQIAKSVVAAFTAGFKRSHGAFKWGKLAKVNLGSHYGFIVEGVVLSKLQPGLSTLVIYNDGQVENENLEGRGQRASSLYPLRKAKRSSHHRV